MKKSILALLTIVMAATMVCAPAMARPHGFHGGPHHGWGPGPYWHHHHHRWYDGGLGFAAGVIGAGIVAGTVDAIIGGPRYYAPAPVVVQQPTPVVVQQPAPVVVQQPAPQVVVQQQPQVVVQQPMPVAEPAPIQQQTTVTTTTTTTTPAQQRVWVEGHWQVQQDAYGRPVRRTWVEGYWQNVQ
ncbi:MAG: hypothetical protein IKR48_00190 [Kiritimatiellae bacterium]|nr:hypothetical protein [Kiritimatiellia bacterium]